MQATRESFRPCQQFKVRRQILSGVVKSIRSPPYVKFVGQNMSLLRLATRSTPFTRHVLTAQRTSAQLPFRAGFSAAAGLTRDVIEKRVTDVLKGFEKVDQSKVCRKRLFVSVTTDFPSPYSQLTTASSFTKDLGLDSLDAVEVVMAVEEVCPCFNPSVPILSFRVYVGIRN